MPDLEWMKDLMPEKDTLDKFTKPFRGAKEKIGSLSLPVLHLPEKVSYRTHCAFEYK